MSDTLSPTSPPLEASDCDDDASENSSNEELSPSSSSSTLPAYASSSTLSSQVNEYLSHYSQFSSQTLNCDRGIKLTQYILWFLSKAPAFGRDSADPYSQHISSTLSKLQNDLSTCRYILRFYGFPQALQAVLQPKLWAGECQGKPWRDARIYRLTKLMAWSMLFYHPLEHLAWLKWNMETDREVVHSKTGKLSRVSLRLWPRSYDGGFFSVWSCRAWLIYIVAEWRCCWLKNQELREYIQTRCSGESEDAHSNTSQMITEASMSRLRYSMILNRLQMVRCALFTVPCFQWSSFHPIVSENLVGSLTLAEAITCMYQSMYALLKA